MKYMTKDEIARATMCKHCGAVIDPDGGPIRTRNMVDMSFDPFQKPELIVERNFDCPSCGTVVVLEQVRGEISNEQAQQIRSGEIRRG